jgi:CubicO group peptidase (beta-lactamase class C family)
MSTESPLSRALDSVATASLRAADIAAGPVRLLLSDLDARGMVLDSLHVVRHGELALDLWRWPHEPTRRHTLHSATKSFTAAAVGLAIAEGLLRLDDYVAPFFEDRFPSPPGLHMRQMRIRDLLTMQSGNTREISGATTRLRADGWINDFLGEPVELPPGTHFQYSSTSSHALSAIVTLISGVAVDEYLGPLLFEPLGITDFAWQRDPEGVSSGGNGLSVRAVDLLKFGVLYLQDGVWQGRRLLPEGWAAQASFPHVPRAHSRGGYGFQFWCFPRGAYGAEGRFGQNCLVLPEQDAVISTTSSMSEHTYGALTGLLLDAFAEAFTLGAANSSPEDEGWIAERAAASRRPLPLPSDPGTADTTASYRFEANERGLETVRIAAESDEVIITLRDERGEHVIRHGLGTWIPGHTGASVWRLHHSYQDDDASILAGAAWAGSTLTLRWLFVETPFEDTVVLEFAGSRVTWRHGSNINSGSTELPPVTGISENCLLELYLNEIPKTCYDPTASRP